MRPSAAVVTALFAVCSSAAELSPNLLRIIGTDARMVAGADLDRQGNSALNSEFHSSVVPGIGSASTYRVLWIEYDTENGPAALTVVIGATLQQQEPDSLVPVFTALDANTMATGDPDTIREAQRRWRTEQPLSPLAEEARRLSQSYDNWFLLLKPFSAAAAMPRDPSDTAAPQLKFRQDLIDAVQEVSGGIRFGAVNEVHLEAVFRNPEDASAVATLARWLPGILQLQPSLDSPGFLLDAIEDFNSHADGQRAIISLRIPDDKVRSLIDSRKRRDQGGR